jgi:hypothetical protein
VGKLIRVFIAPHLFMGNFVPVYLFREIPFVHQTLFLDIIKNGYKIPCKETPVPYSIENRLSAKSRDSFVHEAISERQYLQRICRRLYGSAAL